MRFLTTLSLVLLASTACEAKSPNADNDNAHTYGDTGGVSSLGPPWQNKDAPSQPWWDTTSDGTHYTGPECKSWWADNSASASCCNDPTSPGYGWCDSSGQHNCPGENTKATCNTAGNNDGSGGASCPHYVQVDENTKLYPKCRLANPECEEKDTHCWGTIACYTSDVAPDSTATPVDCGNGVIVIKGGITYTYHTGDFCFTDGNSQNTKWCSHAGCPEGQGADPEDPTKCIDCVPTRDFPNAAVDPHSGACCLFGYDPDTQSCRTGGAPPGVTQDPQFAGFQGQNFQFHGLADEIFNLISTPSLQVNGHFVYLSSGKCDYNDTLCWTHPGTYVDQLGFAFGERHIKAISGPHDKGMHVYMDDVPIKTGKYKFYTQDNKTEIYLNFVDSYTLLLKAPQFGFTIKNSDTFFNMETTLFDQHILRLGAKRHTITDHNLCKKEEQVDETKFQSKGQGKNFGAVEAALQKKYGGQQIPIHGLIGQTWRNALVCGRHWVGSVTDYVTTGLFASDYFFNYFQQE